MHTHQSVSPVESSAPISRAESTDVQKSTLDVVAQWLMLGLFALLPFFFFPVPWLTALQSKVLLASGILAIVALLWVVARAREGGGRLLWNVLLGSAALLPVVYAISAAVNGFATISLVGTGIETDTLAIICVEFAALALTAMLFSGDKTAVSRAIRALFVGMLVLQVVHILHILFPSITLGGVLASETGNALGTWHEFTMLVGLALVMSLALGRSVIATGVWKWIVFAVGVLALPILIIGNFMDVWIAISVATVVLLVVRWHQSRSALSFGRVKAEWMIVAVMVIAILCAVFGPRIVGILPERISVVQIEVRPSWQGTFQIGEQSLSHPKALIFGTGPNTFVRQWGLYKPIEVNQTPFWNADFNVGVAPIPTSFITLGIIGLIAWVGFIVAALWVTLGLWLRRRETPLSGRVLALSIAAIYMLGFHMSSVPGTSLGLIMFCVFAIGRAHV